MAASGGASLTFRAPSKGDDVKRLGKLNTVVGRFAYNEAVAVNFPGDRRPSPLSPFYFIST